MATETILIIDDDPDLRNLLTLYLGDSLGYNTLQASDGFMGLRLIEETKPDLVMLDMNMPAMTGLEMLSMLQEKGQSVPIIFMTAMGSDEVIVDAFRMGVHDYLSKPFDHFAIQHTVERILREAQLTREKEALSEQMLRAEAIHNTVVTLSHHINNQLQTATSAVSIVQEAFAENQVLRKRNKLEEILRVCDDSLLHITAVLHVLQRVTAVHLTEYDGLTPMIDIESALKAELELIRQQNHN